MTFVFLFLIHSCYFCSLISSCSQMFPHSLKVISQMFLPSQYQDKNLDSNQEDLIVFTFKIAFTFYFQSSTIIHKNSDIPWHTHSGAYVHTCLCVCPFMFRHLRNTDRFNWILQTRSAVALDWFSKCKWTCALGSINLAHEVSSNSPHLSIVLFSLY